jgi:hypothetical protein
MSAAAATEVEAHAADSPPRRRLSGRNHGDNCLTVLLVVLLLLIVGGVVFFVVDSNTRPRYSVAIDAVSGLDPAATGDDGRGPTLDPVFDLTGSISPRSRVRGTDCYEPGTTVEVNCHGVLLASGPVEQLCARATKTGGGAPSRGAPACACRGSSWTRSCLTCGAAGWRPQGSTSR